MTSMSKIFHFDRPTWPNLSYFCLYFRKSVFPVVMEKAQANTDSTCRPRTTKMDPKAASSAWGVSAQGESPLFFLMPFALRLKLEQIKPRGKINI